MTQLELIKQQLQRFDYDEVINAIYHDLKTKKSPKSYVVFASKSITSKKEVMIYLTELLDGNSICDSIDIKHRFNEFLDYLYDALDISHIDYEMMLEECRDRKRRMRAMKSPYIFVDTNFQRTTQAIFVLALMEGKRRIRLDKNIYLDKSEVEIMQYAAELVRAHYQEKAGKLALWGKIRAYLYYDVNGNRVVFNPAGEVIEDDVCESKATLKIKNKLIIGDIKNEYTI